MAIQEVVTSNVDEEKKQLKLLEQSREEKMESLVAKGIEIQNTQAKHEKAKARVNELKNELKQLNAEQAEILQELSSGQITMHVVESNDVDDEPDNDDELDEALQSDLNEEGEQPVGEEDGGVEDTPIEETEPLDDDESDAEVVDSDSEEEE